MLRLGMLFMGASLLAITAFKAPRPPEPATARWSLRVRPTLQNTPLQFDDVSLTTPTGDTLSISRLTLLISDVRLLREDGSRAALDGQFGYLDLSEGRDTFTLSQAPVGRYRGITFSIGLDQAVNHSDPSRYPAGHALNPVVNHLHWSWQGGYVFLALEGRYTRRDGQLGGYSYHLATDANRMTVTVPGDIVIAGDTQADLTFDLDRVFQGISPRSGNGSESTHSAPGDRVALQIKSNVERAFTLESVRSGARLSSSPPQTAPRTIPSGTHAYAFVVPQGFPQPGLPADNPLTAEGVALGKRLFFDRRLSGNDTQSCTSCHRPDACFSDAGHARSKGIDGLTGARRTMPLFNLAWSGPYTWDGRRIRLRDQALAPIINTREMHASLATVVRKLSGDRDYSAQFAHAFGSSGVTSVRMGLAIEQYLLTLISADSKFDRAVQGATKFTDQEKRGLELFITEYDPARGRIGADCFHCHGGNLFSDYRYANNGLDLEGADRGRALISGRTADLGKFKTPSLRNVAITAPYMHDGRFRTLEEVVDHYTTGIRRSASLDPNIAKHPDSGMILSKTDKQALIAFLKTLTDTRYLTPGPSP